MIKGMLDNIHNHALEQHFKLPVFDALALELMAAIQADETDADSLSAMINRDPGLAGEVLRLSNSAYFQSRSPAETVRDGIVRLGMRKIGGIAMLSCQRHAYKQAAPNYAGLLEELWIHANACAFGSEWLAQKTGNRKIASQAFLGGLLHDTGKLAMITALDSLFSKGKLKQPMTDSALRELIYEDHARFGAELMHHWKLPQVYQDVAAYHHSEDYDHANTVLVIVRLVNLACRKVGMSLNADPAIELGGLAETTLLGLDESALEELCTMLRELDSEF